MPALTKDLCQSIMTDGIPDAWADILNMQASLPNSEKGWQIEVFFKKSEYGIGVFSTNAHKKGTRVRSGQVNKYTLELKPPHVPEMTERTVIHLMNYACNIKKNNDKYDKDLAIIYIPGNCMNHSADNSNIEMRMVEKEVGDVALGEDDEAPYKGYDLFLSRDIESGEELTKHYNDFGPAPEWLVKMCEDNGKEVNLVFPGSNDYV